MLTVGTGWIGWGVTKGVAAAPAGKGGDWGKALGALTIATGAAGLLCAWTGFGNGRPSEVDRMTWVRSRAKAGASELEAPCNACWTASACAISRKATY